jgi:lipid-A-disaccharide synthase
MLCLLPFEPAFYGAHAMNALFVGHPLADQIALQSDRGIARESLGLGAGETVLALLPGSREAEVRRLSEPFIGAALLLAQRRPGLRIIAPMAGPLVRAQFERALQQRAPQADVQVLDGQARTALSAADVALVASGTATLEALLCRCPMVVAYRVGAFSALLLRALGFTGRPYFSLPNLLTSEPLVPELSQRAVEPEGLAGALGQLLDDAARRAYLQRRFELIHESLRQNGAAIAASAVLQLLRARCGAGVPRARKSLG